MNTYATALLTYNSEVITFGDHRHGGDYNDYLYGINGKHNTFITQDNHTGVLTNVKKLLDCQLTARIIMLVLRH